MTDKELQILLKESSAPSADKTQDERFVQSVMGQVPSGRVRWRVVWTIRLVALAVGILVVVLSQPSLSFSFSLSSLLCTIQNLPIHTWTIAGLITSALVLFFCHLRRVI